MKQLVGTKLFVQHFYVAFCDVHLSSSDQRFLRGKSVVSLSLQLSLGETPVLFLFLLFYMNEFRDCLLLSRFS